MDVYWGAKFNKKKEACAYSGGGVGMSIAFLHVCYNKHDQGLLTFSFLKLLFFNLFRPATIHKEIWLGKSKQIV